ncbi:MAG: YkvA family protein [Casimicrobiaceae bacterium]
MTIDATTGRAEPLKRQATWKRVVIALLAVFYLLSPLDLLPEALLGPLGWLDDLGVLAWAARQVFFERK